MNQLKAKFEGLRVVLIGDIHEQPMLHLKIKPFNVNVRDWSSEVRSLASLYWDIVLTVPAQLHATTTLATQISYWNLTNSHWEPCMFPLRTYTLITNLSYSY